MKPGVGLKKGRFEFVVGIVKSDPPVRTVVLGPAEEASIQVVLT